MSTSFRKSAQSVELSVRPGGAGYAAAAVIILFVSALLARLDLEVASVSVAVLCLAALAIAAYTDRYVIDRRKIRRYGIVPGVITMFTGERRSLRFNQIEQIETAAFQRFRRGRNVIYSYRLTIRGRNAHFELFSGRKSFGRFVAAVMSRVPNDILDNSSIELRDYFCSRNEVRQRAIDADIPAGDVLESSLKRSRPARGSGASASGDPQRAESLRRLGNELRIAGFLLQSLEAFRRAALLQPRNGWLLFDYGRCLHSCAVSEKDEKLERRAFAMMRLAESRAGGDADLLARLGESYFHAGNWDRALIVFRKVTEGFGATFRSVRGLAEIALREGKFAHVIHNFSIANSLAATPSLKRWTNREIEYFTRLNADEEYMELEISRMNLIETLVKLGRSSLRIAVLGIAVIISGMLTEDGLIADVGWAISAISLTLWTIAVGCKAILMTRIPTDTEDL